MAFLSDIIVPAVWREYVFEMTKELSDLFRSGAIVTSPKINGEVAKGGSHVNMPYWDEPTDADVVWDDTADLTPNQLGTGQERAVRLNRAGAWNMSDLAAVISGDDPMKALADLVVPWWNRRLELILVQALNGAFAAASASGNVHDITGEAGALANITANTTIDAAQLLGDAKSDLAMIAMHSATEAQLAKNDNITYVQDSQTNQRIPFFQNKRVIVSDNLPVDTGDYTTYLIGTGAVRFGEDLVNVKHPIEEDRDSLGGGGQDILVARRSVVLHPKGFAFNSAVSNPNNTALALGTNWTRSLAVKQVPIVQFQHKLNQA